MKKYSRIIALLLAVALVLPGAGLAAKAEEDANEVHRLSGRDRYATAVKVSEEAYTTSEDVILASGVSTVDALTGTALAGKLDAPVLYTEKGKLPTATKARLEALGAKKVHILGGEGVVSAAVKTELEGLDYEVERIYGKGRAETAVEVAKKLGATHTRAYLVTDGMEGRGLADALAAAPVSHGAQLPVLLTNHGKLTTATKEALADLGVDHVTIIGGEYAVSKAVETELKALGLTFNRVKGTDRAGTAVEVAEVHFPAATKALIANGWKNDLADALAGGYFGGLLGAPILYATDTGALYPATEEYLDTTFTDVYVLGGPGVVTTAAAKAALEAISPLEVKSVSVITDNILNEVGQRLEFSINGQKKAASQAELELAGYIVEYNTDDSTINPNAYGVVDGSALDHGDKFEYQVVITLEDEVEDDLVIKSDWKEVEVLAEDTIVDVEIELQNVTDDKIDFVTVGEDDNKFAITNLIQANGEKDSSNIANYRIVKAKSSNERVAYADADGDNLKADAKGSVTFTLTIEETLNPDNTFEVKVQVAVKAEQEVKSAALKDSSVKYEKAAGEKIIILVKDQNGDVMKGDFVESGKALKVEVDGTALVAGKVTGATTSGELTAEVDFSGAKVGKHTIKVFYGKTGEEKRIGQFDVQVVDLTGVQFKYALSLEKDSKEELDLAKVSQKVTLDIKANQDGVPGTNAALDEFPAIVADGDYIRVRDDKADIDNYTTGDEKIVIELGAETKVGKIVVEIVRVSGSKTTILATYTINVVNSAPQVDNIKYVTSTPTFDTVSDIPADGDDIKTLVEEGFIIVSMSKGSFEAAMVEANGVEYIESNNTIKITIDELYGGKVFYINNVVIKD